jgi:hypothetical protein
MVRSKVSDRSSSWTHQPVALSSETLPNLPNYLLGSLGEFSTSFLLGLHLTGLLIFGLRASRWIEGSNWGILLQHTFFYLFYAGLKIKTHPAFIATVLKLIIFFLRDEHLLREQAYVNARKKSIEKSPVTLSFISSWKIETVNTAHPVHFLHYTASWNLWKAYGGVFII